MYIVLAFVKPVSWINKIDKCIKNGEKNDKLSATRVIALGILYGTRLGGSGGGSCSHSNRSHPLLALIAYKGLEPERHIGL